MPKGVRRHVGPVGVPRPSLGRALPLSPAPRLSEPARASSVWRPRGSHPAGVGGRRPLPWVDALRRRAGRELVTALRSQFGADQYGRLRETSKRHFLQRSQARQIEGQGSLVQSSSVRLTYAEELPGAKLSY